VKSFFLLCIAAATLAAQDSNSDSGNITRSITAGSEFFDHDFVNFYVYGNGVWDSRVPNGLSSTGQEVYGSDLGWEAGGGVTATHTFSDGGITVNYRGSYRDYQSSTSGSGQQQSLALAYQKRLNRRWTLSAFASGAILGYGSSYFSTSAGSSITPGSPFGLESRFANAGLSLTYEQTRRLSYVFTGSLLINTYSYGSAANTPGAIDSRGVNGGASLLYRLTAKTTIGATYNRSDFWYSPNAGTSAVDSVSLTLSHKFPEHWQIDLSAGINRVHSAGTAELPVTFLFDGQTLLAYYLVPYNRTIYSPAFQGVLSHSLRRSVVSISGGQSVMAGNGLFLASRDQFANAALSYSTRRTNLSFGLNFTRLSSVSTDINSTYSYYGLSASYGVNLVRYVSANFRYDLLHYNQLFTQGNFNESRISFGLSLSSKSVPLTLF